MYFINDIRFGDQVENQSFVISYRLIPNFACKNNMLRIISYLQNEESQQNNFQQVITFCSLHPSFKFTLKKEVKIDKSSNGYIVLLQETKLH